ncbi:primosomal protein N' [Alicyclobacillus fastidiosus]|uniref:Replication restart protein PriA n=1 Tax=Alicyclobacillus fastidiosus TaxID=392011 RepID=A0ABY6ZD03_9BACL|nr:primosomal protein N' [Alicyclobacillus fastidiosus]WAH40402.1 primosomal protein N' [Alicyclobacillus fastidiosus]
MSQVGTVVSVFIDSPGLFLDKPFDYSVQSELAQSVEVGQRVFVSFGHQFKSGVIWQVHHKVAIGEKVKPILDLVDDQPVLTPEQCSLASWLCERYACTMYDAITAILPGAFRVKGDIVIQPVQTALVPDDITATPLWGSIARDKPTERALFAQFGKSARAQVAAWEKAGYLRRRLIVKEEVQAFEVSWLVRQRPAQELQAAAEVRRKRASKQARLLEALARAEEIEWKRSEFSRDTVEALVREGWLIEQVRPKSRLKWAKQKVAAPPELTESQARALAHIREQLDAGTARTVILHGVTGSGKTEVYIRSIEDVLARGLSAIVLVPEIALTPQMVGRFYARFGERIAVLHSALTLGERRDEWGRILRGEASIVIGARSAVFAPVQNLGLLIVDEEHEPSYKQEEAPHYDARDVALERASSFGALTVFGSATPSLQALYLAEHGQARMVTLPIRVNQRPLPAVEIIDMRDELRAGNKSLFSDRLADEIEKTIALGQQVILFLNRRGFASSMLCRACGEGMHCPHCDISLTVHRDAHGMRLVCHYCGYEEQSPVECPACGERALRSFGIGTEQIEQSLKETWPQLRALRMDVDTTRKKGSLKHIVEQFEQRQADVLIGTQMIAKGLDFPHVRLVGVMAADTMLEVPDYRANERTFQLLTQVAGRAGRAETDGVTIIQTYRPDHFAVLAAARHDFPSFYREERMQREVFSYPPFCEMAVFLATHSDEVLSRGAAARFERELRRASLPDGTVVLPASPSGIRRIEDKYRYQVVLKYQRWEDVRDIVDPAFRLVKQRMNEYGGACRLDVNAQRIG